MSNSDFSRFGKRVVQYFWDPLPRNDDPSDIWCLGRRYDSRYLDARRAKVASTGTSPSAKSESELSQADSAVVTDAHQRKDETVENGKDDLAHSAPDLSRVDEEALGWPVEFLDDMEARIWMTYRNNFPPIPKSTDPTAASAMTLSTKLRNIGNTGGFTSDSGWGCMIRSGQSLLANALTILHLGREWRRGQKEEEYKQLLSLFADTPEAPFSIHRFVEHGAAACGKHPGEWFGPSATARSVQALTDKYAAAGLRVYARPDDGDVYTDSLFQVATIKSADDTFQPTLILLGIRLGIDRITPVYHAALRAALELPQAVGIAGGRPSSSHYFVGHQGDQFFYLDPHSTRAPLPLNPTADDLESCHTRRLRRLGVAEMDPSMLLGFLVRSKEDYEQWKAAMEKVEGKAIVHVHEKEPRYATGNERPEAVDEVETLDEGDEEDD